MRPLGPILATSTEPLASVSQVRALADGRLIVHDLRGRRVAMFDSTLKYIKTIIDTTSGTRRAYGSRIGGLIAARGDTSLFVDPASVSMLVINEDGKIVRTIAAPSPFAVKFMIGGPFGTPATDPNGRLYHRMIVEDAPAVAGRSWLELRAETSLVVRVELKTRALDTIARFRIPKDPHRIVVDSATRRSDLGLFVNPIPWVDDWAVLADGSVAVVRGQDYRVEIIALDGTMVAGPKIPFDWRRLSGADKIAIIDSTKVATARLREAALLSTARGRGGLPSGGGRQRPQREETGLVVTPFEDWNRDEAATAPSVNFVGPDELPDYMPAFRQGAAQGDADGNLWIRTTKNVNGGTVYDVINNKGELTDRILIPPGRVIAGFGRGGTVYMGVVDGDITRLERARVR